MKRPSESSVLKKSEKKPLKLQGFCHDRIKNAPVNLKNLSMRCSHKKNLMPSSWVRLYWRDIPTDPGNTEYVREKRIPTNETLRFSFI
ncbi:hypothetical protein ACQKKK_10320 [Peribacillus sp. NPDC006672]|uniref:hypothetical protein n=1 Tax=Peribacillus sp. NPDC006672 TaxID=3390606 RepID=UPI003D04F852